MPELVESFAIRAREYCALIENRAALDRATFVAECRRHLLALYAAALDLPDIGPVSDVSDGDEMPTKAWMEVFRALGGYLKEWDSYAEVFDPYALEGEIVTGSLSDDLADIYRDLRRGLALYDAPDRPGKLEAVCEWKFHFHAHWGKHVTGALRPLHRLLEAAHLEEEGNRAP